MFIADQLIIAKIWNQPICLSTDNCIKKLWYIYMMEYYLSIKNEILPFTTKRIQLETIIVSEMSQSQKDKYYVFPDL